MLHSHMWKCGHSTPPSSGGACVWQHLPRSSPLPQSHFSSQRTSSWKSGLASARLHAVKTAPELPDCPQRTSSWKSGLASARLHAAKLAPELLDCPVQVKTADESMQAGMQGRTPCLLMGACSLHVISFLGGLLSNTDPVNVVRENRVEKQPEQHTGRRGSAWA